ncbi:transcription factor SPT20 homolog [Chelonus insularis]|uniref:transcription factor SPT20 homolog n=1 Tax=Chelonus insularis TaxID=460826 RepID=UPI00158F5945|nr:transcription factor SPT20 homolog [Chelonus insularis]
MEVGFTSHIPSPIKWFLEARARLRYTPPLNMSGHCLLGMARLQILLLVAVPLCAAQFRIQGPSDGNRRAQGLQYDREKGIQYDDQRASLGTGDFTIQGASDGNSNFKIQGATDGNSDLQIYGATDGSAQSYIRGPTDANAQFQIQGATDGHSNFQIQGATDGHSQSSIQGPYDANQGGATALQYKDPSGLNVNWKSYQHSQRAQPQAQPQYVSAPAPSPRRRTKQKQQYLHTEAHIPQAAPVQQAVAPAKNPYYKVYDKAPPQIAQLLQYQQQIPYLNIIPEQFRYNFDSALNAPVGQAQQQVQHQAPAEQASEAAAAEPPQRPQYRGRARLHSRQKRQAQHQRQAQKVTQPPPEPQPQYQHNVPSRIQELIKFQAQIPYINHIPEKWRYEALLAQQGSDLKAQYQRQPEPEPVRHSQRVRQRREAQSDQVDLSKYQRISKPPEDPQPHYNTNLPANLQQLLKFQSQTPYTSVIPEQFSYEKLLAAQQQQQGHRQKRQAPQYQQQQQQQQPDLSQYQRISQPPAEATPQYSTNLPSSIQQLLQFQSQVPYDIIANRITARLDKPYVPQPISSPPANQYQSQPQPQQLAQPQPQYQQQQPLQSPAFQPQYQQPQQPSNPGYQQSELIRPQFHPNEIPQYQSPQYNLPQYNSPQNNIRPVTENQY